MGNYSVVLGICLVVLLFGGIAATAILTATSNREKMNMKEKYPVLYSNEYTAKVLSKDKQSTTNTTYRDTDFDNDDNHHVTSRTTQSFRYYAVLEFLDDLTGELNHLFLNNLTAEDYMMLQEGRELQIFKVVYSKKSTEVTVFESNLLRALPIYVGTWKVNGGIQSTVKNIKPKERSILDN